MWENGGREGKKFASWANLNDELEMLKVKIVILMWLIRSKCFCVFNLKLYLFSTIHACVSYVFQLQHFCRRQYYRAGRQVEEDVQLRFF